MPEPRIQSAPTKRFPKLWVSTPTLDGRVSSEYMHSYDNLKSALFQQKINCKVDFLTGNSILPSARNYLVDRFLETDADWIFMVDSDINYEPGDVLACLPHLENTIVGFPCCKKFAKWDRIAETVRNNPDFAPKDIPAILSDANFSIPESGIMHTDDYGLATVDWIGTGAMLASRASLMKIIAANPEDKVEFDKRAIHQFFRYEHQQIVIDGVKCTQYAGEDVSFCRLAKKSGVEVKAKIDARTGHAGFLDYRFDAAAVSKLKYVPPAKRD